MHLSALTKNLPGLSHDNPDRSIATNPDSLFVLYKRKEKSLLNYPV